jgi:hypothetical protein
MQTRGVPSEGGNTIVVSVAKVYSEILKRDPRIITILAAPNWPFDRFVSAARGGYCSNNANLVFSPAVGS